MHLEEVSKMTDKDLDQQGSEILKSAATNHGRGDMTFDSPNEPKPRDHKFCNGIRVPVFEDGNVPSKRKMGPRKSSKGTMEKVSFKLSNVDEDIMDLYTCPICLDPMIETTATSCGHTFCACCLDLWTKIKPICPICSDEVCYRIRLYNEDQFIEKLFRTVDTFPQELGLRLYKATRARMDRQAKESKSRSILGKVRGKLDDFRLSCKSKGAFGAFRNQFFEPTIASTRRLQNSASRLVTSVSDDKNAMLFWGITIGVGATFTLMALANASNFFYYLYLSIKQYDGKIPAYLMEGQQSTEGFPVTSVNATNGNGTSLSTSEEEPSFFQSFYRLIFNWYL